MSFRPSSSQAPVQPGSQPVPRMDLPSRNPRVVIRPDDPRFTDVVDYLIKRFEDTAEPTTVEDLAEEIGLSQEEIDLLFAVTQAENPTLYQKQQELEKAYHEALYGSTFTVGQHHFISANYTPTKVAALTLAMVYFGVPAPALPASYRAALSKAGRSTGQKGQKEEDGLSFLDAFRLNSGVAASGPNMKSVHVSAYGQTYSIRSTRAFLYGRQGAVRFSLEDPFSFADAIVRLMGANRAVHVVLMKRGHGAQAGGVTHGQTFHEIINDMPRSDPFCFNAIRNAILKSRDDVDSEDVDLGWVPFVFLDGEQPPKDHWRPNAEPAGLVKCIRRGTPANSLRPDSEDVAYLGLTAPFKHVYGKSPVARYQLYSNQYGPWFQVVARILTPGAGSVMLEERPGSLVAHCRLGLAVERFNAAAQSGSGSGNELKPFSTPGGLGFLGSHISAIANAVGGIAAAVVGGGGVGLGYAYAEASDSESGNDDDNNIEENIFINANDNALRYVHFDMGKLEEWSVGVYLAGLSSDESDEAAASISDVNWSEGIVDRNSTEPSYRISLAKCIDRVIKAGTTANERERLVGVDIWPEGYFWNNDKKEANGPLRVAVLPCDPDALGSIDDQPDDIPSVVAIRPVYQSYTACVQSPGGPDSYFTFELDGAFDEFFENVEAVAKQLFLDDPNKKQDYGDYDEYKGFQTTQRGRAAEIVSSQRELNHIVIRQSNGDNSDTSRYPNRPDFLVSRKTTQAEWLRVCSQIVGPEIWVQRASEADWYEKDLATQSAWGFQASYENLLPLSEHEKRWDVLHKKRLQNQETKAGAGAGAAVKAAPATVGVAAVAAKAAPSAPPATTAGVYPHPIYECTFCSHEFYVSDTAQDMLTHMTTKHNVLRNVVPDNPEESLPNVVVTQAPGGSNNNGASSSAADQTGLATLPPQQQRTPPKTGAKKRTRSRTPSRLDPSYRPPKTKAKAREESDQSSSSSSSGEASGSSDKNGTRTTGKKRKASARRSTANEDSTYRPDENGEDEFDHDLGSAKFVPDDFGDEAAKKKRKAAHAKSVHDPSYKPTEGESDEEEEEEDVDDKESKDDKKKAASKKKVDDPSYYPGRDAGADDVDDLDDSLRQSAVPEYDRDPTDPAGKRLRVIREATGRAVRTLRQRKEKAVEKPAVAVTIAKAALSGKGKGKAAAVTKGATTKGKGKEKATASSAASTPRRGRSRNTTPAVDA